MKTNTITAKVFGAVFALLIISVSFGAAYSAKAQTATPSYSCLSLANNLEQGMSDGGAQGQVFELQTFLNQAGNMNYAPTGYFGPITYAAAVAFQAANGVPGTGFVGPLKRAALQKVRCGTVQPTGALSIISVTPNPVAVGSVVTITGRGFDTAPDNTVFFAGGAISGIAATGSIAVTCTTDPTCVGGIRQTMTFTVPSAIGPYCAPGMACPEYVRLITSGDYTLYVQNRYGTTNTVSIAVTGGQVIPQSQ